MIDSPSQVIQEILSGDALGMSAAARKVPPHRESGRGRSHPSTVWRWILTGAKGPGGVVRLEAARVGGRWLTSAAALARFFAALTPAIDPPPVSTRARTRERERSVAAARRRLEKAGC